MLNYIGVCVCIHQKNDSNSIRVIIIISCIIFITFDRSVVVGRWYCSVGISLIKSWSF